MDGVVEVLGLEHRHLEDAMEVDDLGGGGGASFFLRAHAWRAREARCRLALASRAWLAFYRRLSDLAKPQREEIKEESTYIGARFSPFPPSVPSVYAFPANPAPDFPAGFDEFRGITWTFAGVVDGA